MLFPHLGSCCKALLPPDGALADILSHSSTDMEYMLLYTQSGLLPNPGPQWLLNHFAGVSSFSRSLTGMGPRPACSPFGCRSGLEGALVYLFPDVFGSLGCPGSVFREDEQPFSQPRVNGSRIHFRFFKRRRKEMLLHSNSEKISSFSLVLPMISRDVEDPSRIFTFLNLA